MLITVKKNGMALNGKIKEVRDEIQKTLLVHGKNLLCIDYLKLVESEKTVA